MLSKLWKDEQGAILSIEWLFLVTIMVFGLISGWKAVNQAVTNEFEEVAAAVGALSQSYSFSGTSGCCAFTAGSQYSDSMNVYPVNTCSQSFDQNTTSCAD